MGIQTGLPLRLVLMGKDVGLNIPDVASYFKTTDVFSPS